MFGEFGETLQLEKVGVKPIVSPGKKQTQPLVLQMEMNLTYE